MTADPARRRAYRRGHWAEGLAALLLAVKGYRIIARRFRTAAGEVDLIARRGQTLAFVEVKARKSLRLAAESVQPRQRERLTRAALAYVGRNRWAADLMIRFDVILIAPFAFPRHLADAWRP